MGKIGGGAYGKNGMMVYTIEHAIYRRKAKILRASSIGVPRILDFLRSFREASLWKWQKVRLLLMPQEKSYPQNHIATSIMDNGQGKKNRA